MSDSPPIVDMDAWLTVGDLAIAEKTTRGKIYSCIKRGLPYSTAGRAWTVQRSTWHRWHKAHEWVVCAATRILDVPDLNKLARLDSDRAGQDFSIVDMIRALSDPGVGLLVWRGGDVDAWFKWNQAAMVGRELLAKWDAQ